MIFLIEWFPNYHLRLSPSINSDRSLEASHLRGSVLDLYYLRKELNLDWIVCENDL